VLGSLRTKLGGLERLALTVSSVGIVDTLFKALVDDGINIQMISKSGIKVLVGIADKYLELAVHTLHRVFGLDQQ